MAKAATGTSAALALEKRKEQMIAANAALAGTVTFRSGTSYWVKSDGNQSGSGWYRSKYDTPHGVTQYHVGSVARKELGLVGNSKYKTYQGSMPVPIGDLCGRTGRACDVIKTSHVVPAIDVAIYAIDVLGLKEGRVIERVVEVEKIIEIPTDRIVEKIVQRGYTGSFEKREVLAFALTRELRGTEGALRQAYIDNDADESLRLSARVGVIREVMADLTIDPVEGSPQVVAAGSPYKGTGGLFDAV
jgi:hypothetical protein